MMNEKLLGRLRAIGLRSLRRMYIPDRKIFSYRLRRSGDADVLEGTSRRYTAIVLIGLAGEREEVAVSVLHGQKAADVLGALREDMPLMENLGDVALTAWAARAMCCDDREWAWRRIMELRPLERSFPVIELSWTLAALSHDVEAPVGDLRERLAERLVGSFREASGVFPHIVGGDNGGLRSHVSCFADMVYPIQALSLYHGLSGDRKALEAASLCAQRICRAQGPAGQWCWHYDLRTGDVIETYPVYAIHQDAMAPMALFALRDAGGPDCRAEVAKGLEWLASPPELEEGSLIDESADIVWRKVGRRESGKISRYAQALASRVHPSVRVPGLDTLLPPGLIDYEDRPYHIGWMLHAWPGLKYGETSEEVRQ
jgi:hypothetical protein